AADYDQPGLSRECDEERGEYQRCSPLQRVLPCEAAREAALVDQGVHLQRILSDQPDEDTEQNHRYEKSTDRNDDGLGSTPHAIGRERCSTRADGKRHGRAHRADVAPSGSTLGGSPRLRQIPPCPPFSKGGMKPVAPTLFHPGRERSLASTGTTLRPCRRR